jgi:hypothetical protein
MSDIAIKYNNLDEVAKQELDDFLDFLLSRQRNNEHKPLAEDKQNDRIQGYIYCSYSYS